MSQITYEQRYATFMLLNEGKSQKEIAVIIGNDKYLINCELNRKSDLRSSEYRLGLAEKKFRERHRCKPKAKFNNYFD
jgi:IS30 family transposase